MGNRAKKVKHIHVEIAPSQIEGMPQNVNGTPDQNRDGGAFVGIVNLAVTFAGLVTIAVNDVRLLVSQTGKPHFEAPFTLRAITDRDTGEKTTRRDVPWNFVTAEDRAEFIEELFAIPVIANRYTAARGLGDQDRFAVVQAARDAA